MRPRTREEIARDLALQAANTTPRAVRDVLRTLLDQYGIPVLLQVIQDETAKTGDRLDAIDKLARYGLGTVSNLTTGEDDEKLTGVVILPPLAQDAAQGDAE